MILVFCKDTRGRFCIFNFITSMFIFLTQFCIHSVFICSLKLCISNLKKEQQDVYPSFCIAFLRAVFENVDLELIEVIYLAVYMTGKW